MSYPSTNFSQRKNFWSDPNATYNGYLRGVADTSENVRWINEQRGDIESYRTFQTAGTISSDHHWRRNITLTGNVYVNADLVLESDCEVNLNGYFIKINNGSVIQETGSSINGLNAVLKYYSTTKGYYPSIQSAIDNAASDQTVELLSKSYSENFDLVSKNNLTLKGQGTSTVITRSFELRRYNC